MDRWMDFKTVEHRKLARSLVNIKAAIQGYCSFQHKLTVRHKNFIMFLVFLVKKTLYRYNTMSYFIYFIYIFTVN